MYSGCSKSADHRPMSVINRCQY